MGRLIRGGGFGIRPLDSPFDASISSSASVGSTSTTASLSSPDKKDVDTMQGKSGDYDILDNDGFLKLHV
jgi:hypothetical protein